MVKGSLRAVLVGSQSLGLRARPASSLGVAGGGRIVWGEARLGQTCFLGTPPGVGRRGEQPLGVSKDLLPLKRASSWRNKRRSHPGCFGGGSLPSGGGGSQVERLKKDASEVPGQAGAVGGSPEGPRELSAELPPGGLSELQLVWCGPRSCRAGRILGTLRSSGWLQAAAVCRELDRGGQEGAG